VIPSGPAGKPPKWPFRVKDALDVRRSRHAEPHDLSTCCRLTVPHRSSITLLRWIAGGSVYNRLSGWENGKSWSRDPEAAYQVRSGEK
jgi:hypothetical protein